MPENEIAGREDHMNFCFHFRWNIIAPGDRLLMKYLFYLVVLCQNLDIRQFGKSKWGRIVAKSAEGSSTLEGEVRTLEGGRRGDDSGCTEETCESCESGISSPSSFLISPWSLMLEN